MLKPFTQLLYVSELKVDAILATRPASPAVRWSVRAAGIGLQTQRSPESMPARLERALELLDGRVRRVTAHLHQGEFFSFELVAKYGTGVFDWSGNDDIGFFAGLADGYEFLLCGSTTHFMDCGSLPSARTGSTSARVERFVRDAVAGLRPPPSDLGAVGEVVTDRLADDFRDVARMMREGLPGEATRVGGVARVLRVFPARGPDPALVVGTPLFVGLCANQRSPRGGEAES